MSIPYEADFLAARFGFILAPMSCTAASVHDWQARLQHEFASGSNAVASKEAIALEIAFGQARTTITYAVELARAHRIPAQGSTAGDDVWFQLGDVRMRVTLNRRERYLSVRRPDREEMRVRWDCHRATVVADEESVDVGCLARSGIDAVVAAWREQCPPTERISSTSEDTEEELTRR
jgi:hypothetical protein